MCVYIHIYIYIFFYVSYVYTLIITLLYLWSLIVELHLKYKKLINSLNFSKLIFVLVNNKK